MNTSKIGSGRPNPMAPSPNPFPIGSGRGSPFGRTTQRFFVEGEQHEAADWADVVLPPDDEPESSLRSGSFDKIPKRRSAQVALLAFAVLLVVGVVAGAKFFLTTGRNVDAAKAAYTRPAAAAPAAAAATPVPAVAQPPAIPSEAPAGVASSPSAAPRAAPEARRAPADERPAVAGAESTGREAPGPTKTEATAADRHASPSRPKKSAKPRPLQHWVWSPTAQALVPDDSVAAPAPAAPASAAGLVDRDRSPAAKGSLALPDSEKPTIEPPATGAPPPERPAPVPEPD